MLIFNHFFKTMWNAQIPWFNKKLIDMVNYKSVNCYIVDIRVIDLEIISILFWIYMEPGEFHMVLEKWKNEVCS